MAKNNYLHTVFTLAFSQSFFLQLSRFRIRHFKLFSIFVVHGLVAGCYAVQSSSEYYGLKTTNEDVVFLIDVSGSMEGKQEAKGQGELLGVFATEAGKQVQTLVGGYAGQLLGKQVISESTKLGAAKRELIPAIRGLSETQKFAIVTFSGSVAPWHSAMITPTQAIKNTEIFKVSQLSADGGTSMKAALEQAFNYQGVTTIFLMTDGVPTDSSASQIIQRVSELNRERNIKVNTIGIGSDQNSYFLQDLAARNAGEYINLQ